MSQNTTERTDCTFAVKEFSDGTPWIIIEERAPGLTVLKNGFLGIELREGVSFKEAKEIAEYFRNKIAKVSFTNLK